MARVLACVPRDQFSSSLLGISVSSCSFFPLHPESPPLASLKFRGSKKGVTNTLEQLAICGMSRIWEGTVNFQSVFKKNCSQNFSWLNENISFESEQSSLRPRTRLHVALALHLHTRRPSWGSAGVWIHFYHESWGSQLSFQHQAPAQDL